MPDLIDVEQVQVSEVGKQVDADDYCGSGDQREREIAFRALHFPAHKSQVGPSVIHPQH